MGVYNKIMRQTDKLVRTIIILLMLILVGTVFLNIFTRYIGFSFLWADGISRLVFVWMSFLGIYLGYRNNNHPSFQLLVKKINEKNNKLGKFFLIIIHLAVMIFMIILIYGGYLYIAQAHVQNISVLKISVAWKYSAGPIIGILMIGETIRKILSVIYDQRGGE